MIEPANMSMVEEELRLSGAQSDLSEFVTDEGGIWSLREVEKVRGWNNGLIISQYSYNCKPKTIIIFTYFRKSFVIKQ